MEAGDGEVVVDDDDCEVDAESLGRVDLSCLDVRVLEEGDWEIVVGCFVGPGRSSSLLLEGLFGN